MITCFCIGLVSWELHGSSDVFRVRTDPSDTVQNKARMARTTLCPDQAVLEISVALILMIAWGSQVTRIGWSQSRKRVDHVVITGQPNRNNVARRSRMN